MPESIRTRIRFKLRGTVADRDVCVCVCVPEIYHVYDLQIYGSGESFAEERAQGILVVSFGPYEWVLFNQTLYPLAQRSSAD